MSIYGIYIDALSVRCAGKRSYYSMIEINKNCLLIKESVCSLICLNKLFFCYISTQYCMIC